MSRTVYLDGQFVPEVEAKLSIYDLSVMQAAAAFEMTRSFHGTPFKLEAHLVRLERSCRSLGLPWPLALSALYACCEETAARNTHGPGEEHRLLIVVSPGCAPMYRDLDGVIPHPFVYIADFPLRLTVAGMGRWFTEGVRAVTSPIQQVSPHAVPTHAKHRSRLHFYRAHQQAPPGTWPLLMTSAGEYAEAPGANLCYVRQGRVRYCAEDALPGISMQTVATLCQATPGVLTPGALPDELWLTGTPFCMLPVVELDGQRIGDGVPGPVYRQTLARWSEMVGLDIQHQIEAWDAVGVVADQH